MSSVTRRRGATAALLAAAAAIATDSGYLALIHSEPTGPTPGVVPFITVYVAAIGAAALLGFVLSQSGHATAAEAVLVDAMVASAALGFIALFSIGLALVITAVLLGLAARGSAPSARGRAGWVPAAVGALVAIGILVAGLTVSGTFFGS